MQILVSAGEASGDLYASGVVAQIAKDLPGTQFYGCAGPRLKAAGVQPVIDAASLAVVGLAEVVSHLPRIYGEYRKLVAYARAHKPVAALLTDSPDFHLRIARQIKRMRVPVFYLVAPQVWAWREQRVRTIRKLVDHLFCLFPFEEAWFRQRGVPATYIGHPLARIVKRQFSRHEFFARHALPLQRRVMVLLPGSRAGEAARHLPVLFEAVKGLQSRFELSTILAAPKGFWNRELFERFREPLDALSIKVVEGETWDAIGHADIALAASGTVTVEAAILGTPMVTFYKVSPLSWHAGRHLVKVPFLTMVNLIAGERIVPELMQSEMTPARLVQEASDLLSDTEKAETTRAGLDRVRALLTPAADPFEKAAAIMTAHLGAAALAL